ncbi:MAG: hypothetical protein QF767_09495, partial [Alphaproteobacteria bacterium]|nr:hypothetical protein [Alphaproteobacteria bacterium]
MQVSLETERQEQRRWKLRPSYAHLTAFDEQVANEFLAADERRLRQEKKLSAMLRFAANRVPYYGELFGRIDLQRGGVSVSIRCHPTRWRSPIRCWTRWRACRRSYPSISEC